MAPSEYSSLSCFRAAESRGIKPEPLLQPSTDLIFVVADNKMLTAPGKKIAGAKSGQLYCLAIRNVLKINVELLK